MEAIDLGNMRQRWTLLALTICYPIVWLFGLQSFSVSSYGRWAILAAFPLFVLSALGAARVLTNRGDPKPRRLPTRFALYTSWSWLVPYCMIGASAVWSFSQFWPSFAALLAPAPLLVLTRYGREHFLEVALGAMFVSAALLVVNVEAELVWKLKLAVGMTLAAAPFWTLAAYLGVFEHTVHHQSELRGDRREYCVAVVSAVLGVVLFLLCVFAWAVIALTGMQ